MLLKNENIKPTWKVHKLMFKEKDKSTVYALATNNKNVNIYKIKLKE
jgi:hypothetical protein